jgi:hypothetical protein
MMDEYKLTIQGPGDKADEYKLTLDNPRYTYTTTVSYYRAIDIIRSLMASPPEPEESIDPNQVALQRAAEMVTPAPQVSTPREPRHLLGAMDELQESGVGSAVGPIAPPGKGQTHVRPEVIALVVADRIPDFPRRIPLPTKGDLILALLSYAHQKGLDWLTPKEVDFLSTALNERIDVKNFSNFNARNLNRSFVSREFNRFRIEKDGRYRLHVLFVASRPGGATPLEIRPGQEGLSVRRSGTGAPNVRRLLPEHQKLRILSECDNATAYGDVARILRRENVSRSNLQAWRRARNQGTLGPTR